MRCYHPLVASVAGCDEVVGVRLRGGNAYTGRGAASFLTQVFNRVRRAGAIGPMVLRADSGFYNSNVTEACRKAQVSFSISVKLFQGLHKVIAAIAEKGLGAHLVLDRRRR
ncbi:MAG: transposase [Acidimicrobiales bacterium]